MVYRLFRKVGKCLRVLRALLLNSSCLNSGKSGTWATFNIYRIVLFALFNFFLGIYIFQTIYTPNIILIPEIYA